TMSCTTTVVTAVAGQPFAVVAVTVYKVVSIGEASGALQSEQLRFSCGDHAYVTLGSETCVANTILSPRRISKSESMVTVNGGGASTCAVELAVQPLASVTVTE